VARCKVPWKGGVNSLQVRQKLSCAARQVRQTLFVQPVDILRDEEAESAFRIELADHVMERCRLDGLTGFAHGVHEVVKFLRLRDGSGICEELSLLRPYTASSAKCWDTGRLGNASSGDHGDSLRLQHGQYRSTDAVGRERLPSFRG
jgi:hypothetical protein